MYATWKRYRERGREADEMVDMKKYALAYLKYGIAIIPLHNVVFNSNGTEGRCTCLRGDKCGKSSGKHPRVANWQNEWSRDPKKIEDWWNKWPDANIGMVTGKPSGGICVVDVDEEVGRANLTKYVNGTQVPVAKTARTDFDGEHWYFRTDKNVPDKIKGIEGLDFRNFGVIVLPPSQGLAKRYEWKVSPKDITIPDIPKELLDDLSQVKVSRNSLEGSSKGNSSPAPAEPKSLTKPEDYIKALYKFISSSFKFKDNSIEFKGDSIYRAIALYRGDSNCTLEFKSGSRENALFSLANALVKAGKDRQFIIEVMTRVMFTCHNVDPVFILKKIDNAVKRHGESVPDGNKAVPNCTSLSPSVPAVPAVPDLPLTDKIKEWAGYTTGEFRNQDCYNDLSLRTDAEKKNVRKTLGRLADDGILERVGGKSGTYRKIQNQVESMDWIDADITDYYPLKLPMDLHSRMGFYPKNIMVVAGAKSAGKTAFLMNIAWMNKDKGVKYFNSEMGNEELKKRISFFEYPFKEWQCIDFIPRSSNFHDVIDPNAFNIIDFYEIGDTFYKIQEDIRKIHDKLDRGVCIIGLQKNTGTHVKTGRGGDFSKEKSRIYLALDTLSGDQYQLTVVDCKNPVHGTMTGREIPYTLNNATFFIETEATH